nr:hypothetical protein [Tanacetum cinerariifolium]
MKVVVLRWLSTVEGTRWCLMARDGEAVVADGVAAKVETAATAVSAGVAAATAMVEKNGGGSGGCGRRSVRESGVKDRVDWVNRSLFGLCWKNLAKKLSGGDDVLVAGRRQ